MSIPLTSTNHTHVQGRSTPFVIKPESEKPRGLLCSVFEFILPGKSQQTMGPSPCQCDSTFTPDSHPAHPKHGNQAYEARVRQHLVKAVTQGGIIQFVSPAAFHRHESRDLSILHFLSAYLQPVGLHSSFDLGDNRSIVAVRADTPFKKFNLSEHKNYVLTIRDHSTKTEIDIPATEIGISYKKNFFDQRELKKIHDIYRSHARKKQSVNPSTEPPRRSHITSYNGIGRSAALITILECEYLIRESIAKREDIRDADVLTDDVVRAAEQAGMKDFLKNRIEHGTLQQKAEVQSYVRHLSDHEKLRPLPKPTSEPSEPHVTGVPAPGVKKHFVSFRLNQSSGKSAQSSIRQLAHILVNQPSYPRILSALQRKIYKLQKIALNISVTHLKNAATMSPKKLNGLTSKQDSLSKTIEGLIELNSLLLNPDTKIKSTPLCEESLMQALRYNGGQPAKWIALATPVDKRGNIFECMPQSLQAIFQPHWGATALGT